MKSVVRCLVSVACVGSCVLALGACNRDRADRDRTSSTDRDRPGSVDMNRPGAGVPTDRDRSGTVDHDKSNVGTTTVTGANVGTVGNESAIDRIVAARCAREASCNNVGADKHFASSSVCMQKVKADMKDDLNAKECPRGIDQKELDECLESIKKESCGNPIDAISRIAACRTSDLCLKTDMPNR